VRAGSDLVTGRWRLTEPLRPLVMGLVTAVDGHSDTNHTRKGCTPGTPPQFQRIIWDGTGPTGGGGTGRIVDVNPDLGGPFSAWWNLGPNAPAGARSVPVLFANSSTASHGRCCPRIHARR